MPESAFGISLASPQAMSRKANGAAKPSRQRVMQDAPGLLVGQGVGIDELLIGRPLLLELLERRRIDHAAAGLKLVDQDINHIAPIAEPEPRL